MLALKREGRVKLISRNERDHTRRFPEVVEALTKLKPKTFTLDGEVAVFDEHFVSPLRLASASQSRRPRDASPLHGV
jgi:bifunctional non-homologous end joining protein LigD